LGTFTLQNFYMKQKYQIFISSTFTDLKEERQACVEAILRAGHIPAGMELFSASSESQLETIKRWIEDCEIYILLLGGRYGSIEPKSGLSYTEIEYNYALELGKPFFAIIISDTYLNSKVKEIGKDVLELENPKKYEEFKSLVSSKTSRFFDNNNDIKLTIFESIIDIQNRVQLKGWIKATEMPDTSLILTQLSELSEKNRVLEKELKILNESKNDKIGNFTFEELLSLFRNKKIIFPKAISGKKEDEEISLLDLFISFQQYLSVGVTNSSSASLLEGYIVYKVAAELRIYDLVEIVKVANVAWSRYQTSKLGNQFVATLNLKLLKIEKEEQKSNKQE
jgi:hypothetical protein